MSEEEREELIAVIHDSDWTAAAELVADAVIAAGYRKVKEEQ